MGGTPLRWMSKKQGWWTSMSRSMARRLNSLNLRVGLPSAGSTTLNGRAPVLGSMPFMNPERPAGVPKATGLMCVKTVLVSPVWQALQVLSENLCRASRFGDEGAVLRVVPVRVHVHGQVRVARRERGAADEVDAHEGQRHVVPLDQDE